MSNLVYHLSIWIWFKEPTHDSTSVFNLSRDHIYISFILLGVGVGMNWINSLAVTVELVGKYTVSSLITIYTLLLVSFVTVDGLNCGVC